MKYTLEQRLDIGRRIYEGELTRFQAAEEYGINDNTARNYMWLYRDTNHLPPKNAGRKRKTDASKTPQPIAHWGLTPLTEDGLKRLYPPCRPCPGQGAGVLTAAVCQQSQSGGRPCQHLRRVPGGDRRAPAGL